MILLSRDAVEDIERVRAFLDHANPDAAKRALALIWATIGKLQDFPALGTPTDDPEIRQIVIRSAHRATLSATLYFLRQPTF